MSPPTPVNKAAREGPSTKVVNTSDEYDEGRAGFPSDPSEFDSDPRISFFKLDQKFILETDDGQEFEFDHVLKRWIPIVCPDFIRTYDL